MARGAWARRWGPVVLGMVLVLSAAAAVPLRRPGVGIERPVPGVARPAPGTGQPAVGVVPARPPLPWPVAREGAAVMVYFLERYARNVADKTDMDRALERRLGGTPASRAVAMRMVSNFKAIPLAQRQAAFGDLAQIDPNTRLPAARVSGAVLQARTLPVERLGPSVAAPPAPSLLRRGPASPKRQGSEGKPEILPGSSIGREPLPAGVSRQEDAAPRILPVAVRELPGTVIRRFGTTTYGIQYAGLYCREETDWDRFSNSDEPYVLTVVVGPNGVRTASQSAVYGDVDGGETRIGPAVEAWPLGSAQELTVVTTVMENDDGDPPVYLRGLVMAVDFAISAAESFGFVIPEAIKAYVGDFVRWLFGQGDDLIQAQTVVLPAATIAALAANPPATVRGVEHHFSTRHQGGGADYYAMFRVTRQVSVGPVLTR